MKILIGIVLALMLVLAACRSPELPDTNRTTTVQPQPEPGYDNNNNNDRDYNLKVADQELSNAYVSIEEVTASKEGWLVIYTNENGQPDEVIGYTRIPQGTTEDFKVQIDLTRSTPTLYAMVHEDAGKRAVYEYPGPDAPVTRDGNVVMEKFTITKKMPSMSGEIVARGSKVGIKDHLNFDPKVLITNPGTTVTWTNNDNVEHTITGSDFDSGTLKPGETFTHTFNQPGQFNYYCKIHPDMIGAVIVRDDQNSDQGDAVEQNQSGNQAENGSQSGNSNSGSGYA